jgi:hypothetical protein
MLLMVAAGIALIAPMIGYRAFWNLGRFWITIILLGGLQVPLVMIAQPYVEPLRFAGAFILGVADCFVITLALAWVCSQEKQRLRNKLQ